jgi:hypothetical protein
MFEFVSMDDEGDDVIVKFKKNTRVVSVRFPGDLTEPTVVGDVTYDEEQELIAQATPYTER